MSIVGSFLVASSVLTPAPAAYQVAVDSWQPQVGDRMMVDTKENTGYIIHPNSHYIHFPVVTGQRRWVYYIGRGYNASTPNWDWVAKSKHIKGDRMTFGHTGRFIRLYKDGEENTAYGIHEYGAEDVMFARDTRYQSMGCIIVKRAMMDVIERTYDLNAEQGMSVITRHGIEGPIELALAE